MEKRYILLDEYEGYGIVGQFDTLEEVQEAARNWEQECDGECSLVTLEFDHYIIMGAGQPNKVFYHIYREDAVDGDENRSIFDKHICECSQIARYDDELRRTRELIGRFVELCEPHPLTIFELQRLLTDYIGLREEAVKLLGGVGNA